MADIIILAIISVILGVKLFSILGQKRDNVSHKHRNKFSAQEPNSTANDSAKIKEAEIALNEKLEPSVKLRLLDPSFDKQTFLNNAKEAFKLILSSYSKGDTHTLSKLLNVEMMKKFAYEISKREDKGDICSIEIVNINDAVIKNISFDNYEVSIKVGFKTEVINYVVDQSKKIISGHKTKLDKTQDQWVFKRDLRSPDPTWYLVDVDKLFV